MTPQKKPTFVGVGVTRAATTWTYDRLCEHPDVADGYKQMNFFSQRHTKLKEYLNYYSEFEEKHFGEWSPGYFTSILAVERMHDLCPQTKVLINLRNPVDRLYSFYHSRQREADETLDRFVEFVLGPGEKLRASGNYVKYVKWWQDMFEVKVNLYEDLIADPQKFSDDNCRFLELKPHKINAERIEPKRYAEKHRERLVKLYSDPVKKLGDYLKRDLSGWLN